MSTDIVALAEKALALQEKIEKLKAGHKTKLAPLEEELSHLEETLTNLMREGNQTTAKGKNVAVDQKTKLCTSFEDFDKFATFVLRRKALHLFERRIAANAYKELREQLGNKPLPGVREFEKHYVNVRRA